MKLQIAPITDIWIYACKLYVLTDTKLKMHAALPDQYNNLMKVIPIPHYCIKHNITIIIGILLSKKICKAIMLLSASINTNNVIFVILYLPYPWKNQWHVITIKSSIHVTLKKTNLFLTIFCNIQNEILLSPYNVCISMLFHVTHCNTCKSNVQSHFFLYHLENTGDMNHPFVNRLEH